MKTILPCILGLALAAVFSPAGARLQRAVCTVRQEHRHVAATIEGRDSQPEATLCRPDDTTPDPVVEPQGGASTVRQEHLYVPARIATRDRQLEAMLCRSDGTTADLLAQPQAAAYTVRQEYLLFPARIDGRDYQLEAMFYRPDDANRRFSKSDTLLGRCRVVA